LHTIFPLSAQKLTSSFIISIGACHISVKAGEISVIFAALIVVSAVGGRFEKPSTLIFLSYIFPSAKPKQENVGGENADLLIS